MSEVSGGIGIKENMHQAPDVGDIIAGQGLEFVREKGWEQYRQQLEGLTWESIAMTQIDQINALRQKAKTEPPFEIRTSDLLRMEKKTMQYVDESVAKYPRNSDLSYDSHREGNKKLYFTGKSFPDFGKEKTTRIYMALREDAMPFATETLREQLAANGALEKMSLVLNLEVLQGGYEYQADNNAIVMYVPDSNAQTLTKVSEAIANAKKANPKVFELLPEQLADVKMESTATFMLPLDDTTWFVEVGPQEQGGLASYHSSVFADIGKSVYRGHKPIKDRLPDLDVYKETLASRRPEIRQRAPIISHHMSKPIPRRISMPGLIAA